VLVGGDCDHLAAGEQGEVARTGLNDVANCGGDAFGASGGDGEDLGGGFLPVAENEAVVAQEEPCVSVVVDEKVADGQAGGEWLEQGVGVEQLVGCGVEGVEVV